MIAMMYPSHPRLLSPSEVSAIDRQCITVRYPDDETPVLSPVSTARPDLNARLIGGFRDQLKSAKGR